MTLLRQLGEKKKNGQPIIAVVTGTGLVVNQSMEAGVDVIFALNAGFYRNIGVSSLGSFLPFANANQQTEELIKQQFLPYLDKAPVVAGVFAHEGLEALTDRLSRYKRMGIQGVTNWPAVGLLDDHLREALKAEKIDVNSEIEMLNEARRAGFNTFGFVWDPTQARVFAQSGVECLILNLGLTQELEDVKEHGDQLQINIKNLKKIVEAVRETGKHPISLFFGGVVSTPDDLEILLRSCAVDGFAGGSVFDRIPVQKAVSLVVRQFKNVPMHSTETQDKVSALGDLLGSSQPMKELFEIVRKIARADVNVCIEGESGTGKELVASQIHQLGQRSNQPFVTLNCGAIPDTLFESELFGHEKGAFTGADRRRLGKFELAHGGILFLDEISDLSPHGQVALLRSIQQREITRVGGEKNIPIDVRILAASNRDLLDLVNQGKFRADLYYRLNGVTIKVPPLSGRNEDIVLLVNDILRKLQVRLNKEIKGISPKFLSRLQEHSWPGNVRELEHVICEAAILEESPVLQGTMFKPTATHVAASLENLVLNSMHRDENRRQAARKALEMANGNKSKAAKMLKVTRKTLYSWIESGEGE